MKKQDVKVGESYLAKVSGKVVPVRITGESRYGGWNAVNRETNREVRIKSAQRLRRTANAATRATSSGNDKETDMSKAKKTTASKAKKASGGKKQLPSERLGVPPTTPDVDEKVAASESKAAKPAAEKPRARKKAERKDGTMSGLDAAAKVLGEANEPLNTKTIVERAIEKGYWKSGGKTPAATVYAAIIREIAKKGDASRFTKADRGRFTVKK